MLPTTRGGQLASPATHGIRPPNPAGGPLETCHSPVELKATCGNGREVSGWEAHLDGSQPLDQRTDATEQTLQ